MSRHLGAATLAVIVLLLAGCGGDEVVQPTGPQPSPDNATITGKVVQADNVSVAIARALVIAPDTGFSTETSSTGEFTLRGMPAGRVRLRVEVPQTPGYESASVEVPTRRNQTTTVSIAVLPTRLGTPTALFIHPLNPSTEQGGRIQFAAAVYVGDEKANVQPTWILSGDNVGTIDARGLFQAVFPGSALVTAVTGDLERSTGVVVTGPLPPDISTVILSHSVANPLPASGGTVTITAAITDGNGVRSFDTDSHKGLKFEIYPPDGSLIELTPGDPVAGTIFDGTWRASFTAPANSNIPGPDGVQAPQVYSVRVAARDLLGNQSFSGFYEFAVAGVEAPPPLP